MTDDREWIDEQAAELLDLQAGDAGAARASRPPLSKSRDDMENDSARRYKDSHEGWFNRYVYRGNQDLTYGHPDNRPPYEQRSYPDAQQSLEDARKYGAYAEPSEAYINQKAKIRSVPLEEAIPALDKGLPLKKTSSVDIETAAQLAQAREAANRSAIIKLGYDPGNVVATKPSDKYKYPASGRFERSREGNEENTDRLWYDQSDPSALAHESVHRGMRKLLESGTLPEDITKPPYGIPQGTYNEYLTRAVMQRFFGNVENADPKAHMGQINAARTIVPKKQIDDLEAAAQKLLTKHGKTAR